MKITQIKRIPAGETTSKVTFLVDGHNLETNAFPNTTTKEAVKEIILERIDQWKEQVAAENIAEIDQYLETLELEV